MTVVLLHDLSNEAYNSKVVNENCNLLLQLSCQFKVQLGCAYQDKNGGRKLVVPLLEFLVQFLWPLSKNCIVHVVLQGICNI